ncbi:MAG: hypothetical protein AMXMBFR56_74100 [Polyangiaceae bacterium]
MGGSCTTGTAGKPKYAWVSSIQTGNASPGIGVTSVATGRAIDGNHAAAAGSGWADATTGEAEGGAELRDGDVQLSKGHVKSTRSDLVSLHIRADQSYTLTIVDAGEVGEPRR